eukprot:scaffold7417_cov417-Prasinococcus_capsulatus_cf.AAC.2
MTIIHHHDEFAGARTLRVARRCEAAERRHALTAPAPCRWCLLVATAAAVTRPDHDDVRRSAGQAPSVRASVAASCCGAALELLALAFLLSVGEGRRGSSSLVHRDSEEARRPLAVTEGVPCPRTCSVHVAECVARFSQDCWAKMASLGSLPEAVHRYREARLDLTAMLLSKRCLRLPARVVQRLRCSEDVEDVEGVLAALTATIGKAVSLDTLETVEQALRCQLPANGVQLQEGGKSTAVTQEACDDDGVVPPTPSSQRSVQCDALLDHGHDTSTVRERLLLEQPNSPSMHFAHPAYLQHQLHRG